MIPPLRKTTFYTGKGIRACPKPEVLGFGTAPSQELQKIAPNTLLLSLISDCLPPRFGIEAG
jgi:hypothetical protein